MTQPCLRLSLEKGLSTHKTLPRGVVWASTGGGRIGKSHSISITLFTTEMTAMPDGRIFVTQTTDDWVVRGRAPLKDPKLRAKTRFLSLKTRPGIHTLLRVRTSALLCRRPLPRQLGQQTGADGQRRGQGRAQESEGGV